MHTRCTDEPLPPRATQPLISNCCRPFLAAAPDAAASAGGETGAGGALSDSGSDDDDKAYVLGVSLQQQMRSVSMPPHPWPLVPLRSCALGAWTLLCVCHVVFIDGGLPRVSPRWPPSPCSLTIVRASILPWRAVLHRRQRGRQGQKEDAQAQARVHADQPPVAQAGPRALVSFAACRCLVAVRVSLAVCVGSACSVGCGVSCSVLRCIVRSLLPESPT